ncbi:uncharacterized protein LOC144091936 [Stigmatopora argus]
MAKSSAESDSFIKWKNRKLVDKTREFNNLWTGDIQARNERLQASSAKYRVLEEKLDAVNKEKAELLSQHKIYEAKIFLLTKKKAILENQVNNVKGLEAKMKERVLVLEESEVKFEARLSAQAEEFEENLKKAKEEMYRQFRNKELALQGKTEAQSVQLQNMEKRVQEMKNANKKLKVELGRLNQQNEQDREKHQKKTAKMEFDFQLDIRTAKMKNKVMTDRVETLLTTSENKVKENERLREKLERRFVEVEKRRTEQCDTLLQVETLTEKLQREQKRTASLTERVTRMEKEVEAMWNKYEIEQKAHGFTKKHSGMILRKHRDLTEKIKFLDHRVKSQQVNIQKLESGVSAKSAFIRNLSQDIEASLSLLHDPKKLIKEITRIKGILFAEVKESQSVEPAEILVRNVSAQKAKFDRYEATINNLRRQLEQRELALLHHIEKIEKPRSQLIQIVNEQRRDLSKVKSKLNQARHTLREVNSYLPEKVQSWVDGRLLGVLATATPKK